jgi:hypothetical protein
MIDASAQHLSVCQSSLQVALKEILAQQQYTGVVPTPPDFQTVARRALEIEQALREASHRTGRDGATT